MITIHDKSLCCGCAACAQTCPKQCINMIQDDEGFLYPTVNKNTCIDCGLCEKVCHELHPYDEQAPLKVLAAINRDENVRMHSSSGGIFHLLAEKTISAGGVVFGARFDEDWQVVMDYAESMEGVRAFMGSKYIQARTEKAYKDAKRFLAESRQVLFSGTPCQIAGLKHFLRKEHDNLLAVDFICHGTPSPKIWNLYLEEILRNGKHLSDVKFRDKTKGWKNFGFKLTYNKEDDTVSLLSSFRENPYMKSFLRDIILRPSCYACKAKAGRSHSDVTIADFWGIQSIYPEMDDDKGTGLVFANTRKGLTALESEQIKTAETEYEKVKPLNPACFRSPKIHPKRDEYFLRILQGEEMIAVTADCTKPTYKQQVIRVCSKYKHLIINTAKYIIGGGKSAAHNPQPSPLARQTSRDCSLAMCSQIEAINFRNKQSGWKSYCMEIKIKNNETGSLR